MILISISHAFPIRWCLSSQGQKRENSHTALIFFFCCLVLLVGFILVCHLMFWFYTPELPPQPLCVHSFIHANCWKQTRQGEMRCRARDDMWGEALQGLSLCKSRVLHPQPSIIRPRHNHILNRLTRNGLQMAKLVRLVSYELLFLLRLKLPHIVLKGRPNLCLRCH